MTYVQKNCKACGDLIEVRLSDHKRGWGNFCDKACSAAYKCNQRPKDVNEFHSKYSMWAKDRMDVFSKYPNGKPPTAPSIKSQVGKVKIVPVYHSPSTCWVCGEKLTNGEKNCFKCGEPDDGDYSWDSHKNY